MYSLDMVPISPVKTALESLAVLGVFALIGVALFLIYLAVKKK